MSGAYGESLTANSAKRVLIVGANSYIGESFAGYAKGRLDVDIVDSYEGWKVAPFHEYNSVVMAAGLAHQKWNRKQQKANKNKYFAINHDLAVAVAEKAKAGRVGQFIYLSSMAVYGLVEGVIAADAKARPRDRDYYGRSKYRAEVALTSLFAADGAYNPAQAADAANLCIVRPPMVYGPGCPGKFSILIKIAKKLPFIPKVNNKRSMIFIDNLCEFLCLAVEQNTQGVFSPHNKEYMNTTWLLKAAREAMGKRTWVMPGLGLAVLCLKPFSAAVKTAFGSLYYDEDTAVLPFRGGYQLVPVGESVVRSLEDKKPLP